MYRCKQGFAFVSYQKFRLLIQRPKISLVLPEGLLFRLPSTGNKTSLYGNKRVDVSVK